MATREASPLSRRAGPGSGAGARRADLLIALALVLTTVAVYAQVRKHQFLFYDDPDYVVENPNLRLAFGWESVRAAFCAPYLGNWAPLTSLSLRLDFALYRLAPAGYLLTNVAMHALSSVLLFAALARMTGARGRSAFVAAVFALHPLHVESVAWISERKDVLAAVFFMLGLCAYAAYVERPRLSRLALVTLWLCLGLLSKATLVTFPFVLLLLDVWPLGRLFQPASETPAGRTSWQRAVFEKLPMFLSVAAVATLTFALQRAAGAVDSLETIPLATRVRNALESYVGYVASSFWPSGLAVIYPHPLGASPLWHSLAAALLLIGASAWVARSARARPYLAVGWLWYLGMLVPMIGIVQAGSQAHADRYMYLPLIGLAIMLAWGGCDLLERARARRFAGPAAGLILGALGICAWFQIQYWRDSFVLFEHALAVTAQNAVPHLLLGTAYIRKGDVDAAERHYAEASAIDPRSAAARIGLADVRVLRGDLDGAIAAYERELQNNPRNMLAAGRYGVALLRAGRAAEAQRPLEVAVAAHPGSASLHVSLAVVYAQLGRMPDAIRSNRVALQLDPEQVEAANNLAWELGTRSEATPEERQEAVLWAERANRRRGGVDASLLDTLAVAYAAAGRFDEAAAAAARAVSAAEASGQREVADEIRARSALFAARRAWVEPSPRAPKRAAGAAATSPGEPSSP